jgi:hypothetical protein
MLKLSYFVLACLCFTLSGAVHAGTHRVPGIAAGTSELSLALAGVKAAAAGAHSHSAAANRPGALHLGTVAISPIPEPSAWSFVGLSLTGLAGIALCLRR